MEQHFDVEVAAKRWLVITRRNKKLRAERAEDEKDFTSLPPLHRRRAGDESSVALLQVKANFGTFAHGASRLHLAFIERVRGVVQALTRHSCVLQRWTMTR